MEPLDPNLIRKNRAHTGRITGRPTSSPRHLGSALPGSEVPVKGLPEADRREPLAGAAEAGSHLAGDEVSAPSPRSQPVRRGHVLTWVWTFMSFWGVMVLGLGITMFWQMDDILRTAINMLITMAAVIAAVKTHDAIEKGH